MACRHAHSWPAPQARGAGAAAAAAARPRRRTARAAGSAAEGSRGPGGDGRRGAEPRRTLRMGLDSGSDSDMFDVRHHSTGNSRTDLQSYLRLPHRIVLVRHGESLGNVDPEAYTRIPDPQIPLTRRGHKQARLAGENVVQIMEDGREPHEGEQRAYFIMSPYRRSKETYLSMRKAFKQSQVTGVQEEVQLREQDFGNFQDAASKRREKDERLEFGRFYYRFPNGESGADVYDRLTIFEDHIVRDMNAGRYANVTLVLITHGLALRIFLMRWLHWSVEEFEQAYNPPNSQPIVLERRPFKELQEEGWHLGKVHTKEVYRMTEYSRFLVPGVTPEMCATTRLSCITSDYGGAYIEEPTAECELGADSWEPPETLTNGDGRNGQASSFVDSRQGGTDGQ